MILEMKSFDTTKKHIDESRSRTSKKMDRNIKDHLKGLSGSTVGLCYFFENIVVFGDPIQLGSRIQNQLGEHLGTVYCKMPSDPFRVLYRRIKNTPSWIKRKGDQKSMDFFAYSGKSKITRCC